MRRAGTIKRASITLLLMAIVGAAMWTLFTPSTREPVYEGKTLSEWLEDHGINYEYLGGYHEGWPSAKRAIEQIGTNGIPTLLRMLRAKDPPAPLRKLRSWAEKWRVIKPHRLALRRNGEAAKAFAVLGTNAAAAVPELIQIYEDRISLSSHECAARALGSVGPIAVSAIPVLLRDFSHTSGLVRSWAVMAASQIGGDPSVLVPAFTNALTDVHPAVRLRAVIGLARFSEHARPAVPQLLKAVPGLLQALSRHPDLQEEVENAVWQIAPEKIGYPLLVGNSGSVVTNGRTSGTLVAVFNDEPHTWIHPGTPLPCIRQFYSSEPYRLRLYCSTGETNGQFLGEFEVPAVPPPPDTANVSLLCVVTEQEIFLCARDNRQRAFVPVRRVDK